MDKFDLAGFSIYLDRRSRPNTVRTYIRELAKCSSWLNGRMPAEESLQLYIDHLEAKGYEPNTIACAANAIRRWAKWKKLHISLDSPKITIGDPKYIEEQIIQKLVDICQNTKERALIIGLFDTGCRISEYINLETDDIDWDDGLIIVTRKGGRLAHVNISDKALKELRKWLKARQSRSKRVFMDMTYNDAWTIVRAIGQRLRLHVTPHMFRHSRAVQMLDIGTDPYIVQQHLGHTSISTTLNIYGRLRPMKLKEKVPETGLR